MRYSFARFILDTESHKLQCNGTDIAVEPQVFDLLHLLLANAGKLVTKDQMMDAVWQGRIVSEATVSARINAARKAVGDNGKDQAIIRTVARRGLEMAVPVEIVGETTEVKQHETSKQTIKYTTSKDGAAIAFAVSGSGPPLLRAGHNLTHLELDWASSIWPPLFNALGKTTP
jgi:DNA-binding winged helix-turn-helix (wHTH) protein